MPFSSPASIFSSCALISDRIHAALANNPGLILHRTQWQCLVSSYSKVLQVLTHLLQHSSEVESPSLTAALRALHEAMLEGERCMGDCIACPSHSWLLDKGLKLGVGKDVVDIHLHHFSWAFGTVLDVGLNIGTNIVSRTDTVKSDLVELTKELSNIWACEYAEDDISSACNFLSAIKDKEEGDTSYLADFILQKMSHAQELECVAPDVLPAYLWVDSESLQRNPEILGLGGYGKVHEAVWLGGCFAVKDFFYVENNQVFGREAAIQARLRHPNVIPLVCCTKKPSLHKCSIVMELMRQDLRVLMLERIEAGSSPPFSLGVAVDLMLQVAQGMEYLHSLHIMHRDLKSSNILVSFSKETCHSGKDVCAFTHLKIADFGMSKAKHASSMFTTKQVGATLWRAPEVFEINPEDEMEGNTIARYTKKADVYSFGLVCYEILTGNSPFEGTQVRKRVLAGERPKLPSYYPRALSSYIESCWDGEPSKRPPFSQICRVLCYLKASTLLQEYHSQSPAHYSWLSQPLSPIVCAPIDDMVRCFMEPRGILFQPQPLNIPLEMYCCRVVLQQRGELGSGSTELTNRETGLAIARSVIESNDFPKKNRSPNMKLQQRWRKANPKAGGNWFGRLKKLLSIPGNHIAKSELQDALGMVRDFSFSELQVATNHFSKEIGEGGFARVYYGILEDGREIAVKVPSHSKTRKGESRLFSFSDPCMGFEQELRIASQLRHRNILPLFGWCQARGNLYLIYEFMPNGDLSSHIFGKLSSPVLSWQQRHKISYQLASALKYLHHDSGYSQIVHRDVKVRNVLLDSEWNARLGDCGIAVTLRDGETHELAGTVGYIAPEVVFSGEFATSSDVYAFGITILEIISGRKASPLDDHSETQYIRDWVSELFQKGNMIKVADVRLRGEFEAMELKRLLLLGLSCTSAEPHLRPCMTEVLEILSSVSEPPPLRGQTVQPSSFSSHTSPDRDGESSSLVPTLQQNASQRVFLYKELKVATNNFRPSNLLGEGGSGTVFKGWINEVGPTGTRVVEVAVKRLSLDSLQDHKQWLAEVSFLSQLHHPHLVKLIGCCSEDEHQILVYEFMPHLNLDIHLFQGAVHTLDWATRMKIALGAAKGLAFLHGAVKPVIIRNLNTSKILLDSNYTAKLTGFMLAKSGPLEETHVITREMGTNGYLAPECVLTA